MWATRSHPLAHMLTSTSLYPLGQGRVFRHARNCCSLPDTTPVPGEAGIHDSQTVRLVISHPWSGEEQNLGGPPPVFPGVARFQHTDHGERR